MGVSSVPEFTEVPLKDGEDICLLLVTAGVSEFLPPGKLAETVASALQKQTEVVKSPALLSEAIIKSANLEWKNNEEIVDDCTCVALWLSEGK